MAHFFRGYFWAVAALLLSGGVRAQNTAGFGDWQLHLPTNFPRELADSGERVYVATEFSFYYLDKALNTTQVLSRRDGLSDVGVAALAYDSLTRQTVVAYRNTNIDVIRPDGKVRNLNDVLRKSIQGQKGINDVYVSGRRAYLATSFGLVVVNLEKLEVTDTYSNIGPGGTMVQVFGSAITHDTIFVTTSAGVLRGRLSSSVNLLDYRNWTREPLNGDPNRIRALVAFENHVYVGVPGSLLHVYRRSAAGFRPVNVYSGTFRRLRTEKRGVLVIDDEFGVRRLERAGTVTQLVPRVAPGDQVLDAFRSRDGSYYVANYSQGLLRARPGSGQAPEFFRANGPERTLGFGVLADARTNKVNVFTGGFSERYLANNFNLGFYEYADGQWTNYIRENFPSATAFPNLKDMSRGARTPDGTLYVASYGDGLLEWKGKGEFRIFNDTNSPLRNFANAARATNVSDVAADAAGNVWVVVRHLLPQTSGLYKLVPATTDWTVSPFVEGLQTLDRLALDDVGYVWVSVSRKTDGTAASPGVIAVDPSGANAPRYFSTASGLPSNEVYDLHKDRRGDMWVATITGVGVLNDPGSAFLPGSVFRAPIVRRGEGAGFPALFNEAVRAIAVDGGNRKWFATDNGLWLFSEDADEALLHFTTANSPLPSNRIVDVDVNDKTGEVWVTTDGGVVSYRGAATVTEGPPSCSKVFPNPVRPGFTGVVGIAGLANNALVKITDIAGHLVYATKANGGTVTWDLNTAEGQRVRSGVYLVLTSDADGKNTCVSKVAVLSK
jgi:hypothetical protein